MRWLSACKLLVDIEVDGCEMCMWTGVYIDLDLCLWCLISHAETIWGVVCTACPVFRVASQRPTKGSSCLYKLKDHTEPAAH